MTYLGNGTYDQVVAHIERELELSGLENDGEPAIPTTTAVPQMTTNRTLNKQKVYATIVRNQATLSEIVVKDEKGTRAKK